MISGFNKKIIKINYKSKKEIDKYKSDKYKNIFNWKLYVCFYKDLKFDNFEDAWIHWVTYGIYEKRYFFIKISDETFNKKAEIKKEEITKPEIIKDEMQINQIIKTDKTQIINYDKNNIIYKNIYDNYGLHFYGWKSAINNFLKLNLIFSKLKYKIFFDEWIEKLLIWGNISDRKFYLNKFFDEDYKIVTFMHNPPFKDWYRNEYKQYVKNKIIFNDEHTNQNLFKTINELNLEDKIIYLYTLSNKHKQYVYKNFPNFRRKIMSIFHPIEINGNENTFDYNLFCKNKKIYHIGWWLRNFKTFVDLNISDDFKKHILIKNDFKKEWNIISQKYNLDNIIILNELNNEEYEKIFINSCIFLDLEDCVANNIILECIKFNTPLFVKKLPSIVEYLGKNYPLYFENEEDLIIFNNTDFLLNMIQKANNYLINMDKSHISNKTFNDKLYYDLKKLQVSDNKKLTWFCFIDDFDNLEEKMKNLLYMFVTQNNNQTLELKIIIDDNIFKNVKFKLNINYLNKYSQLYDNFFYYVHKISCYSDFLDLCMDKINTDYIVIIDINDIYDKNYSNIFIEYLDNTPSCDITFSSYTLYNKNNEEKIKFDKDTMLFNDNFHEVLLHYTGIVWRKELCYLLGKFIKHNDRIIILNNFYKRAIKQGYNIMCCESNSMYKILC